MANIFNKVRDARAKYEKRKEDKQKMQIEKAGKELEFLKAKSKVYEEREKILMNRDKQRMRYKEAKQNLRKRTPTYRIVNALADKVKNERKRKKTFGNLPDKDFKW